MMEGNRNHMLYYKNPITRFILRRKLLNRIKMRTTYIWRKLTKNAFDDLQFLFSGKQVTSIIDVGANIGFVTYQFLKRFPKAHIYAFEPNPEVFQILKAGYINDQRVSTFALGIGDINDYLQFNTNANTGTSSFLKPTKYHSNHQAKKPLETLNIEVKTIDKMAATLGVSNINILKLDIEGYELRALIGAKQLLENQAIDAIYTEVALVPQYRGQPLFHEITIYLEKYKYYLYNIDDFIGQESNIRQASIGNAIYISNNFRNFLENHFGWENCGW